MARIPDEKEEDHCSAATHNVSVHRDGSSEKDVEQISGLPEPISNEAFREVPAVIDTPPTTRSADNPVARSAKPRGLFGRFSILVEAVEPQTDYSRRTKWFITFVVAVAAAGAPLGSAILYPALDQVAKDLNSTATVTNMSIALYMLSMSIFPLWWSAFSEHFGRRTIYLVSFLLFVLFSILSAISNTIGMFVAMRMLAGGASASVQAVGAGTIADVWEVQERGRAMGIFYLGPLCGPLFAPIIGGALSQGLGWRSTMWLLVIYGGVSVALIFFGLPETLKSRKPVPLDSDASRNINEKPGARDQLVRVVSSRSVQQTSRKWAKIVKMVLLDPLKIILYLRFPPVLLTVYWASLTFGSLYVLNISIQDTFHKAPYRFSDLIVGLLYVPASLGYVVSSIFGGRWIDTIMRREARKRQADSDGPLRYRPEDRMRENAWLGTLVYSGALIWYGWTAEKGVLWVLPVIASFFFGCGSMLIFSMATTMLTEFMPRKSSSGVAVNNFMRNIFSCVGGIVAAPIVSAIGNGWIFTILGLWALSSCSIIWAMRRYGSKWRTTMDAKLS